MRAEIAEVSVNSSSFDQLVETVFSKSGLRATMLQLSLIQRCDNDRAISLLKQVKMPSIESQNNLSSARRIAAKIWYLRAIYKTHSQFSSLAEAIALWKQGLCPNAAIEATELMHKLL